jgi:hypothetical protein
MTDWSRSEDDGRTECIDVKKAPQCIVKQHRGLRSNDTSFPYKSLLIFSLSIATAAKHNQTHAHLVSEPPSQERVGCGYPIVTSSSIVTIPEATNLAINRLHG